MKYKLSILIPARNEMFLARTIKDILVNIRGNTEVIAVLDGVWSDSGIPDDSRVTLIYYSENIGQRAATNQAAKLSKAKYLMKVDAHCSFDKGFDVKMMKEMHDDWTMVPLMKNLHGFDWICSDGHRRYQGPSGPCKECGKKTKRDILWRGKNNPQSISYCFDATPHFQYFKEYAKRPEGKGEITETMSLQGSCWMLTRDKYWELNICDEKFGSWGSQGIEVAVKTWLSGGRVMVNKKTWYSHMFRTQGKDFGFPYKMSGKQQRKARDFARDLFFNNKWPKQIRPLSWLVERFWPVKGWTEKDLKKLKKNDSKFYAKYSDFKLIKSKAAKSKQVKSKPIKSKPIKSNLVKKLGKSGVIYSAEPSKSTQPSKGIIFYTDNQLKLKIAHTVQKKLRQISEDFGISIVSASLKPMPHFGKNVHLKLKKGILTMFKQILAGLEASDADIVFFCFQGNMHVETIIGQKRIDKIKVGELVKTHLGRFRSVTKVFKRPYKQRRPIIQVNTEFSSIRCTPEHPFYVYRNNKKQWLSASFLEKTDLLLYPSKQGKDYLDFNISLRQSTKNGGYGKQDIFINKLKVDINLARFLGLYLAEGHYNEKELHQFIKNTCDNKFHRRIRERKQLGPLFKKWFGGKASTKKIPKFVFNWNIKNKLAFVKGFLEGDGSKSINDNSYYGFNVASKQLVKDMIVLLNNSGIGWDNDIKERLQTKFSKKKNFKDKRKVYSLNFSRIVYRKLKDILKSDWVDKDYIGISIHNIKHAKMSPMPLYKNTIRTGKYANYVYNLEVEEDNSYIVQSSIVHNCEHDVLYHQSHFDFIPAKKDVFYYNINVWKVREEDGYALKVDVCCQTSGLVGYREELIKHYKERIKKVEEKGKFERNMGFEPGTHRRVEWENKYSSENFKSLFPNVDIRHSGNLTVNRWSKDQFRNQKWTKGWTESKEIPGWGKFKDFFK